MRRLKLPDLCHNVHNNEPHSPELGLKLAHHPQVVSEVIFIEKMTMFLRNSLFEAVADIMRSTIRNDNLGELTLECCKISGLTTESRVLGLAQLDHLPVPRGRGLDRGLGLVLLDLLVSEHLSLYSEHDVSLDAPAPDRIAALLHAEGLVRENDSGSHVNVHLDGLQGLRVVGVGVIQGGEGVLKTRFCSGDVKIFEARNFFDL